MPPPPMTYEIEGEQYLSVLSGWGSVKSDSRLYVRHEAAGKEPARVITFKLGGSEAMPAPLQAANCCHAEVTDVR